jgi:hypothetical protein
MTARIIKRPVTCFGKQLADEEKDASAKFAASAAGSPPPIGSSPRQSPVIGIFRRYRCRHVRNFKGDGAFIGSFAAAS